VDDDRPSHESILARAPHERRQFPRFRAEMRVEVFRRGADRALKGSVADISEGGIGAQLVGELPVGDDVTLEVSGSPLLRPVRATATVRNRNGARCGFQFTALSREQRTLITAACLFLPRL
jgi:c-di-GMP-binding flagellar brake protein YcgR